MLSGFNLKPGTSNAINGNVRRQSSNLVVPVAANFDQRRSSLAAIGMHSLPRRSSVGYAGQQFLGAPSDVRRSSLGGNSLGMHQYIV